MDQIGYDSQATMRADIHIMIALMYDNTGITNRVESLEKRTTALEIRLAKLSPSKHNQDEILIYNARMDYTISLLQDHDYKTVEPLIEECHQKYHQWGPPEEIPYEYSKYYNKLALVRMYQQRFDEAITWAERSISCVPNSDPFPLQGRRGFHLACILLQSGDIARSYDLHRDILDRRAERLGQTSELTLHSCHAVGCICELQGKPGEAM